VARGLRLPVLQRERVGERLGEVLLLPAGLPERGVLPVACWLRETVREGLRVPAAHTEGLGERVAAGEALRVPAPLAEREAAAEDTAGERVPLPQAEAAALRLGGAVVATGLPEPEGRREREGDTEPLRVTVAGAEVAAGEREGEPEAQAVGARVVGAGVLLRVRSTVPLTEPVGGAEVAAGEREGEPEAQPVGARVVGAGVLLRVGGEEGTVLRRGVELMERVTVRELDLLLAVLAVGETVAVQEEETVLTRILTPSLFVATFSRFQPLPVFM
jgi:hypothetical protein